MPNSVIQLTEIYLSTYFVQDMTVKYEEGQRKGNLVKDLVCKKGSRATDQQRIT